MSYEKGMTIFLTIAALSMLPLYFASRWFEKEEQKEKKQLAKRLRTQAARKKKKLFREKRRKMKSIKYQRKG
jgi:hypothetical protein